MNRQDNLRPISSAKSYQTTVLAMLITAIVVGGGVYYIWQQSQLASTEARSQEKMISLQNQIASYDKEITTQEDNSETRKEEVAEQKPSNAQDNQKAQSGFTKLREEGLYVYYRGTATVSGTYQELFGNTSPLSNILCFYPNESSKSLIPRENNDAKSIQFCFGNQDETKAALGINDSNISSKNIGCIEGKAIIEISNYKTTKIEGEASDNADLSKVISKEAYETSCSQ